MSVNMGTATGYLDLDTSKFKKGFKSALADLKVFKSETATTKDKLAAFGSAATSTGKSLTKSLTAPIVGVGAAAVAVTAKFDAGMSKVQAISGATGQELAQLRDKAKEMGAKTKFSASQSAEAFQYMAMAGWKTKDMLDGIEGVMNLAAASGEDLATTSDIVTDALTAFGLSAKDSTHFADVLAAASSNANTNVGMLGETFKYVAPVAGALKFSVEDVSTAIGLMANSGIKGSQAGTALRSLFTRMAKPTKQSAAAMKELGVSMTDQHGKMKDFNTIMGELRQGFSGLTEAEKAKYAADLAGQYGMSGLLAIVNTSEKDYNKLKDAIYNADGASQQMADTMMDNLPGALTLAKSALEGLGIRVGEVITPAVTKIVQVFTKFVAWLTNASDGTVKFVVAIGAMLAAIGPLLLITGSLARNILSLITLHQQLASLMEKRVVRSFLLSAKAKIVDSVATIQDMTANLTFRGVISRLGTAVITTTSRILALAAAHKVAAVAVLGIIGVIIGLAAYMIKTGTSFSEMKDKIVGAVKNIADKIPEIFSAVGSTIQALIPQLLGILSSIASQIPQVLSRAFTTLQTVIPQFLNWWAKDMPQIVQAGANVAVSFVQGISKSLPAMIASGTQIITQFITGMSVALPNLIEAGLNVVTNLVQGISEALSTLIPALVTTLTTVIPQLITAFVSAVPQVVQGIVTAITTNIAPFVQAIVTVVTTIAQALIQNLPILIQAIVRIVTSLAAGIIQVLPILIQAAIQIIIALAQGLIQALPQLLVAAVKIGLAIVTAIIKAVPKILQAGVKLIQSLGKGVTGKKPWLLNTVKVLARGIPKAILAVLSALLKAGVELIKSLWKGIKNWWKNLKTHVKDYAKKIPTYFAGAVTSLLKTGADLVQGLWDGFKKKWADFKADLDKKSNAISKVFNRKYGVRSPSRWFMRFAGYLVEGLSIGWNKSYNAFVQNLGSQIDDVKGMYESLGDTDVTFGKIGSGLSVEDPVVSAVNELAYQIAGQNDGKSLDDWKDEMVRAVTDAMQGMQVTLDKREMGRFTRKAVKQI